MAEGERFVVVSLGSIGRRHLANLRSLRPDANIAVCRLSDRSGDAERPEHADRIFQNINDVIGFKPLAAIVAGPASTHAPIATALAGAGIHLLIEKPLTISSRCARELVRVIQSTNVVAMVGYNLRFMPGLSAAKSSIDAGEIGRAISVRAEVGQFLPDWRPTQDYRESVSAKSELGGGALLELSHEFDYLTWMFGIPKRVTAHGGNFGFPDLDVEDLVEILLQYDSPKMLISVHLDFLDRAGFRGLRVIGEAGTICWNAQQDVVTVFEPNSRSWRTIDSEPLADRNEVYVRELRAFLKCIETGCPPEADFQQACSVLDIIDATRQSIITGSSVEVLADAC